MTETESLLDARPWEDCDGSSECLALVHLHGCFSDDGTNCDHPSEHSEISHDSYLRQAVDR